MKQIVIPLLVLLSLSGEAQNLFEFSAVAPTGQRLYYVYHDRYHPEAGVCITTPGYEMYGLPSPTGSLSIPSLVTSEDGTFPVVGIGSAALRSCTGLTSVTIPNSVRYIGGNAFQGCSGLTSVTIPNSVTSIDNCAFCDCSGLTSVTIPNSVTSIGCTAFSGCTGLTSVTISNSVTYIDDRTFFGCSGLTSVTIPNSVTRIMGSAFSCCTNLISVTIGNAVTGIDSYAFAGCSSLTSVNIPNSVTYIWDQAFFGCSSLNSVRMRSSNPPRLGSNVFPNTPTNMVVEIPCGTLAAYQQAWGTRYNYVEYLDDLSIMVNSNNEEWGSASYTITDCTTPTIELTATAIDGHHFTEWNDGNTDNPRIIMVMNDVSYTAHFAINNYCFSATSNDASMGSVTGSGNYDHGTAVTLTAEAAPCHHFEGWSNGATTASITFTATEDVLLTAIFARDADRHSHELVTSCLPYTWSVNGKTYNKSGVKTFKGTTAEGCVSRDTLTLNIVKGYGNVVEVTSCLPYTWDVTGKTYNKSGVKTFKTPAGEDGCAFYDTLKLNIVKGHSNTVEVTTCVPYTWDVTGKTYNKSGVKTFKSSQPNADGCYLYDTLYLSIIKGYTSYEHVENCGPYHWDVTGKTYNKSGLKTFKSSQPDAGGCYTYDTLDLVVLNCDGNNNPTPSSEATANLSLYPNPTSGRLQIDAAEVEKVEILDMVGRRVALFENTATIDLSSLADGTYTLRVTLPDGLAIRKVVKK